MKHKITYTLLTVFLPILTGSRAQLAMQARESVVTLERTTCFGTCPSYKLTILGDGTVNFEGREFVRIKGKAQSKIDPASVESLVKEFNDIDYFALEDEYITIKNADGSETSVTDLPTTITTFTFAGKQKKVIDYIGAPKRLVELEDDIDKVVNSKRWVSIDAETVREKCRHGWDVNGKEGRELLVHASRAGDADVVRAFIAGGANVKKPVDGISLLQVARGKEVFEALISAGADVNGKPGNNLYPPILWAAELGETDSLAILIKAGAKVNSKSSEGATALMMAAGSGVPASVRLLLSAGADPAQKDKDGETALDYARHAEQRIADEEAHPGLFSSPMQEFRAKFEEIKKLLTASQQGTRQTETILESSSNTSHNNQLTSPLLDGTPHLSQRTCPPKHTSTPVALTPLNAATYSS
jgi:hypothetical protein